MDEECKCLILRNCYKKSKGESKERKDNEIEWVPTGRTTRKTTKSLEGNGKKF